MWCRELSCNAILRCSKVSRDQSGRQVSLQHGRAGDLLNPRERTRSRSARREHNRGAVVTLHREWQRLIQQAWPARNQAVLDPPANLLKATHGCSVQMPCDLDDEIDLKVEKTTTGPHGDLCGHDQLAHLAQRDRTAGNLAFNKGFEV